MATTPAGISGTVRGVSPTLSGCIIQSYTKTENAIVEQVADQNGAIAAEVQYDTRIEISVSLIASTTTAPAAIPSEGQTWSFDGETWFVDSVSEGQTYNAATQWTISAHRYTNTPAGT